MPEITTITSESLQAEVRRLLPSQRGFGQDLEAQNVIVPIIDLTPTAEGSALREDLQTASSFGAVSYVLRNSPGTSTVVSTTGFYRYSAQLAILTDNAAGTFDCSIKIVRTPGGERILHRLQTPADASGQEPYVIDVQGITFLTTNDALKVTTIGADSVASVSAWPIADVNGNFINPSGFSFE